MALLAMSLCGTLAPDRASAQIQWLNFEDGDVLNVSTAILPPAGRFEFRGQRGIETSADRGEILAHRLRLTYSVSPHIMIGGAGTHFQQRHGELFKDGMGDSDIFVQVAIQPWKSWPFHLGLRQSLSLPTGFEQERDGLAVFTSRHNDYTAQLLFSYETRGMRVDLNPGVIVPGGDAASYLTMGGALTLDRVTFLDLDLVGEYFTRWNMVEEAFESDVYFRAEKSLFWGISVHGGVKRRLLQSNEIDPEMRFGLSLGRPRLRDLYVVETPRTPVHLAVPPAEVLFPDPHGFGTKLHDQLRAVPPEKTPSHVVYLDSVLPGTGHAGIGRTHELRLTVIELDEGAVGGARIPMLLRAPRTTTTLTVQLEVIGPGGVPLERPQILRAAASRGLGAELAPASTSLEVIVVPDEIKNALRREVLHDMAAEIATTAARIVSVGESR